MYGDSLDSFVEKINKKFGTKHAAETYRTISTYYDLKSAIKNIDTRGTLDGFQLVHNRQYQVDMSFPPEQDTPEFWTHIDFLVKSIQSLAKMYQVEINLNLKIGFSIC